MKSHIETDNQPIALNQGHIAYTILDKTLASTKNYTVETAIEFVTALTQTHGITLLELECRDAMRIAMNISKVRQVTGKRGNESYLSPALRVLSRHQSGSKPSDNGKKVHRSML